MLPQGELLLLQCFYTQQYKLKVLKIVLLKGEGKLF